MRKFAILFAAIALVYGITVNAVYAKKPVKCGDLGSCVDAVECINNNPGVEMLPCEEFVCEAGCCEISGANCPCTGVGIVTVDGGGKGSPRADTQIKVTFYCNPGIIESSTVDSVTVCPGTGFALNIWAGQGPHPSTVTYDGVLVDSSTSVVVLDPIYSGIHELYLDNKDNGGNDTDIITIQVAQ